VSVAVPVAGGTRKEKALERQKANAFKAAKARFAEIEAIAKECGSDRANLLARLRNLSPLRHRGKGRGAIEHRYGRMRSAYMPHQGLQERLRRVRGGWAIRPGQPFTKEAAMASVEANRRDRAAHTLLTGERLA
jgi:hypothetical protein